MARDPHLLYRPGLSTVALIYYDGIDDAPVEPRDALGSRFDAWRPSAPPQGRERSRADHGGYGHLPRLLLVTMRLKPGIERVGITLVIGFAGETSMRSAAATLLSTSGVGTARRAPTYLTALGVSLPRSFTQNSWRCISPFSAVMMRVSMCWSVAGSALAVADPEGDRYPLGHLREPGLPSSEPS